MIWISQRFFISTTSIHRPHSPIKKWQYNGAAIDYMQTNFGAQLSIDNLVNHVGYSRSRFFELFKSNTGMTPNDYLQRLRLEAARSLLAETSRSVTDIAFEVGFNSSQYFSTVFLQYTGLPPSGFRSQGAR